MQILPQEAMMKLDYKILFSLLAKIKNPAVFTKKYHHKNFINLTLNKNFNKQKERQKWKFAIQKASKDKEYMKMLHEEAYLNDFDETR